MLNSLHIKPTIMVCSVLVENPCGRDLTVITWGYTNAKRRQTYAPGHMLSIWEKCNEWGFEPPLSTYYRLNWARRIPRRWWDHGDSRDYLHGEMNEMTLPSMHRIRNSSPGGMRPVIEAPHNIESLRVSREETFFFDNWRQEQGSKPRSLTFQAGSSNHRSPSPPPPPDGKSPCISETARQTERLTNRGPRYEMLKLLHVNRLYEWSVTWKMNFNYSKCKSLTVSRRKAPVSI